LVTKLGRLARKRKTRLAKTFEHLGREPRRLSAGRSALEIDPARPIQGGARERRRARSAS
jgi:hypothetical protein